MMYYSLVTPYQNQRCAFHVLPFDPEVCLKIKQGSPFRLIDQSDSCQVVIERVDGFQMSVRKAKAIVL